MFNRPHQRAAPLWFLAGTMCIVLALRADAAPPAITIDDALGDVRALTDPAATQQPPSSDSPPPSAEAAGQDPDAHAPLPVLVSEQEQQALPAPSRSFGTPDRPASSEGSWLLQTLTALGIVIALIFAMRAVLIRLTGTQTGAGANRLVEVLARATIGHKTQIVFLKIHQRVIVAAQTPAGLDTLTTMDDPEEVAWLLGEVEAAKPMSFTRSFRQVMHRFDKDYTAGSETGRDTSEQYVDRTRDELSGLMTRIRLLKDKDQTDK